VTSQRGHWPLLIRTRYVCTCVGAGSAMGGGIRKIKAIRWGAYYYSLVLNAQPCKYDMYKSSLRHKHDPALSSLKMKGIRLFFLAGTAPPPPQWARVSSFTSFLYHTQRRTTPVGLLWRGDQPNAETSTSQHTTLTTDTMPRWDSKPKSQQTHALDRAATGNGSKVF
jgi:hypothetical protein